MHQTKTTRSIQTTYNIWIRAATAYSLDLKKTYIQHTHIYYHHCCKHSARFFDLFRNNIINPFEGSTRSFRSLLRSLRQDDCEISHWRSLQCIYSQIVFFFLFLLVEPLLWIKNNPRTHRYIYEFELCAFRQLLTKTRLNGIN